MSRWPALFVASACCIAGGLATAQPARIIVANGEVRIEVIAEGAGPLVVLLPSRGRGSADFDQFAAGIAKAGFRVLRPQPRGVGTGAGAVSDQQALAIARKLGWQFDIMSTSFFLSRRSLRPAAKSGMPRWQDRLFITLAHTANDATDYFKIPTGRVVEVGTQVTI